MRSRAGSARVTLGAGRTLIIEGAGECATVTTTARRSATRHLPRPVTPKRRRPTPIPPWVIPPRSVVVCIAYDRQTGAYKSSVGQRYRIGDYGACRDGIAVVWLVDALGEYVETTDHDHLQWYFRIVRRSGETDYYGDDRRPCAPCPVPEPTPRPEHAGHPKDRAGSASLVTALRERRG